MMNDIKVSPDFTIDDIHKIRFANYERTKNMTRQELIEHTRREAQPVLDRLSEMKKGRVKKR